MSGIPLVASTSSGSEESVYELPILDVTHQSFPLPSQQELDEMEARYLEESHRLAELPEPVLQALRNSILGKALFASAGTFLAGLPTYMLKLGPENLGPRFSTIDQRIAGSFPALCARVRVADMARLMASALLQRALDNPQQPICLINIGGGTAADCWNALILARRESPALLEGRSITVAILDPDSEGPTFALNAFRRLAEPEGPLHGLNLHVQHRSLLWSPTDQLSAALAELKASSSLCILSSEGALFEYGSDTEIRAVLTELRRTTPENAVFVGSVTRAGRSTDAAQRASLAATRPRTIEAFAELAASAGWRLDDSIARPFSYQVRIAKSKP